MAEMRTKSQSPAAQKTGNRSHCTTGKHSEQRFERFNILEHLDLLEPTKRKDFYHCPNCGKNDFHVNPMDGKFACFSGGCSSHSIVEALKRKAGTWKERGTGSKTPVKRIKTPSSGSEAKTEARPPFPGLAKYPEPMEATPGFGRDEKGNKVWDYSKMCRMVRIEKKTLRPNGKPEKICFPKFCGQNGKGDNDWGFYNLDSVLSPTPENKGKLLLMVEGEPCTDTAAKLGLIGLTPQAAEWDVEKLVPFLKAIAEMGYAGIVCNGDNDVTGGKHMDIIRRACEIVGLYSVKLDMKTLWTDCPEHGDITDWYDAGLASPEILEKAVEDAWRMHVEPPAEESKEEPDNDYTPQSERKVKGKKDEPPNPVEFAQELAKVERDRWRFHNEQKTWREWNGKYWEAIPHEDVGDVIHHQVKSFIKTDTWIENCLKSLERELRHRQWMPQSQSVRAFANGVVDMETLALTPHNPEHYNTSIIPRDWWQPDGEPIKDPLEALRQYCPHIYEAWHHAMGGDERKILKLLAICNGVLAWRFSTLQKFIHLIGKPGTGKGTFSRILGSLVGEENTKASKLSRLGGEYDVAHWIDSQLLTLPDEGNKYSEDALDTIKSMTGGDAIPYRQIFKEVGSSPFYGTLLIISNDPIFRGETGAIKRRLCLVEFDIPIINRNSLAEELMLREIPQLTYCALSMPSLKVDAIVNGLGEHEIPSFNSKAWELETAENSVADFLDTELVPISNCKVYVKDVYSEYTKFCSHTGQKAVAMNKFSSRLITASDFVGWEIERGKARNGSYIIGVDIREEIKHQHIPTPSEVFKKAEKAYSPNQPSQPSQPDRARVPAVTPIVTEPSQEPSQPSHEQIPIDFSASARVEAPTPSPSPSKTECDDTGDDTVMVDVTVESQSGQGRDGCDDTLKGCSSGNEQSPETDSLADPWGDVPESGNDTSATEEDVSNDSHAGSWLKKGSRVKLRTLLDDKDPEMIFCNEGVVTEQLEDGRWKVFWKNWRHYGDHQPDELVPNNFTPDDFIPTPTSTPTPQEQVNLPKADSVPSRGDKVLYVPPAGNLEDPKVRIYVGKVNKKDRHWLCEVDSYKSDMEPHMHNCDRASLADGKRSEGIFWKPSA